MTDAQQPPAPGGDEQHQAAPADIPEEAARLLFDNVEEVAPGADQVEKIAPQLDPAAAAELSKQLVEYAAGALKEMHPALDYQDHTKKRVEDRLTPLVIKYDAQLPPWLVKWQEELLFLGVIASVAYGSVMAVKKYNEKHQADEAGAPGAATAGG